MVEGIIRLHDGEDVLEKAIKECNMFLGLGITKESETDEEIITNLKCLCMGGAGLNDKLATEALASFVVETLGILSEASNKPGEEKTLARWFQEDLRKKLAARMGADVPEENTAGIMINVGGGMEEAIRIMEAMAKAKEECE